MNKLLSVSLTAAILAFAFSSCKKLHDENPKQDGQIKFSISALQLKNVLESTSDSGVSTGITSVVVTIEDLEGNDIKNQEKIDLYNMNGYYISKPISLVTGGYKLSQFLVLNGMNKVVYAAPLKGSTKAYLIENPLPLSFTITKDSVTKLAPEVVSTAESNPSDFGYNTFSFEVAETFDFLIGTFIYNDSSKNFELTTANIKIWNDTYTVYEGALKAKQSGSDQLSSNYDSLGITNKITLPERYNSYILEITKPGYKIYCDTFMKEELRLYYRSEDNGPLVVILEKEIVNNDVVLDIDGNIYQTITIGTQTWMIENLRVTKYNNGIAIPNVTDNLIWANLSTPAYCWYNNDEDTYKSTYGALYNWYTVNTGNLCPLGWHVPTDSEWKQLEMALGMSQSDADAGEEPRGTNEGSKLAGNAIYWAEGVLKSNPAFGTSGFLALPSGNRNLNYGGTFSGIGYYGYFWSGSKTVNDYAWARCLAYNYSKAHRYSSNSAKVGFPVRCIKD
jgi:uncharacterized protein (TIGR02145 family)